MSIHSRMFRSGAVPTLLSTSSDPVTIRNTATGERLPCRALVTPETLREVATDRGRRKRITRDVSIAATAASSFGGSDDPRLDWKVDVDGTIYDVEEAQGAGGGLLRLVCCRPETLEHTRPGLRERQR